MVMVAGYCIAGAFAKAEANLFWSWNLLGWLLSTATDGAVLRLGAWLVKGWDAPVALAILAPSWVVGAHLVHAAMYAVWRLETRPSWLDREWIARLSATEMLAGAGWMLFGFVCLWLPHWLHMLLLGSLKTQIAAVTAALSSGPIAALLGRSSKTALNSMAVQVTLRKMLPDILAGLASAVFMVALLALGSVLGWRALSWLSTGQPWDHLTWSPGPSILRLVIGIALLLVFSWALGSWLNVNRFSLHEMYRNRLARAFLGAANPTRRGDGFTNFDEHDRVDLRGLTTPVTLGGRRLFPMINTAMNLTSGTRTAWTERKAASFTMTPLHCGSAALDDDGVGVFVPTADYGGVPFSPVGIQLDTAITISGAAVSPNAGYHSSPTTSFIMTLFNARLGAWMPNPAKATAEEMRLSKPPNSFSALIAEMFGQTNDKLRAVYLSDGGHFENLGLYEMLRRRCAVILAVDAGCDPEYQYYDLGNAIRKARIDLGVEITFFPNEQPLQHVAPARSFLRAQISYPRTAGLAASTGVLLYLKSHMTSDIPADVMAYAAANPAFPHETTGNQFFTESQFESYRCLGEFLGT
jgi:hypothetical protein